jgi:hypothetical protein
MCSDRQIVEGQFGDNHLDHLTLHIHSHYVIKVRLQIELSKNRFVLNGQQSLGLQEQTPFHNHAYSIQCSDVH